MVGEKLYLGTIIGDDNAYYKAVLVEDTLAELAKSNPYGGQVQDIALGIDGSIYAVGVVTNTVRKYDAKTLKLIAESPSYGATINTVAVGNDGYVYAGGSSTVGKIKKYHPYTLEVVAESPVYNSHINDIAISFDGHVLVCGQSANGQSKIKKYDRNTLSLLSESQEIGGTMHAMIIDLVGDVFVSRINGDGSTSLVKVNSDTLSIDAEKLSAPSIRRLSIDSEGNIYTGGGSGLLNIYDPITLEEIFSADVYNGRVIYGITIGDNDSVYIGGETRNVVKKININVSNNSFNEIAEFNYGGSIQSIVKDEKGDVYAAGVSQNVVKLASLYSIKGYRRS